MAFFTLKFPAAYGPLFDSIEQKGLVDARIAWLPTVWLLTGMACAGACLGRGWTRALRSARRPTPRNSGVVWMALSTVLVLFASFATLLILYPALLGSPTGLPGIGVGLLIAIPSVFVAYALARPAPPNDPDPTTPPSRGADAALTSLWCAIALGPIITLSVGLKSTTISVIGPMLDGTPVVPPPVVWDTLQLHWMVALGTIAAATTGATLLVAAARVVKALKPQPQSTQ